MESKNEADRLLKKSDEGSTREQLIITGLKPGMTALDAGGGAGFVSQIMCEIVGEQGKVVLCDQSQERLDTARKHYGHRSNLSYLHSQLERLPVVDGTFDYVFSRFVFEYLPDQNAVFTQLMRVTKPGGKLVIGDLDHNVLNHYPLNLDLELQLQELVKVLEEKKLWDPYAGRKLYSFFHKNSFKDIRVHLIAHHLVYGEASTRDLENLKAKLDQMCELQKKGTLDLSFDMSVFSEKFLEFFKNPARFSYTPLVLVEGVKS